jgi:hypothetical protein
MPDPSNTAASSTGKAVNPFAKNTYRVLNEPIKILGILDSRYAQACVIPAVACGLFAASSWPGRAFAFAVSFAVLAWQAHRIAEEDAQLPRVLWLTFTDKSHACAFLKEKGGKS